MGGLDIDKIKQLDGALLLVLRELLRQRRATVAAQRLGLSQSAVSHALSRLRELFDDPLFVRTPQGLEPTRHALELAPRIDALLGAMQDAIGSSASFDPAESRRSFRIGAPDYVCGLLAPGLWNNFISQAPQLRFVFSQRLGEDAERALLRDELDVAVGRFGQCGPEVVVERLFEDRYCLVARRDHPKLRDAPDLERYMQLPQVQVSATGDFRIPDFIRVPRLAGLPRVVASVPRFWIAFAMVAETDAVAIAPERVARRSIRERDLRILPLPFAVPPIVIFVAKRSRNDPGTDFLIEQLRVALHANPETKSRAADDSDAA